MLLLFIELLLCISQDSEPLGEHSSSPLLPVSTAAIFLPISHFSNRSLFLILCLFL